ncbi:BCAN [Branchiostoma lanceolatum]|uniref:BCAN protein n=1 Tax=Branchiostoma lanceolatum TaxID=7740 RepID=A0A8J9ZJD9_BRALA|nr:BCAN [Branchiostoma lanceolatum]
MSGQRGQDGHGHTGAGVRVEVPNPLYDVEPDKPVSGTLYGDTPGTSADAAPPDKAPAEGDTAEFPNPIYQAAAGAETTLQDKTPTGEAIMTTAEDSEAMYEAMPEEDATPQNVTPAGGAGTAPGPGPAGPAAAADGDDLNQNPSYKHVNAASAPKIELKACLKSLKSLGACAITLMAVLMIYFAVASSQGYKELKTWQLTVEQRFAELQGQYSNIMASEVRGRIHLLTGCEPKNEHLWRTVPNGIVIHRCYFCYCFTTNIAMPRLSYVDKLRAVGQVEAGTRQRDVAALFGVRPGTISKLVAKFRATGDVKDMPRTGRPRATTPEQDQFLTRATLRDRRLSSTRLQTRFSDRYRRRISRQTIRNRLHSANLRARKAARRPALTEAHRQARLRWCRRHRNWNREWRNVMFSDESRFNLRQLDGRVKVWRRRGERFANCCTDKVTAFGGGSVMVWGGITSRGKTRLVIVPGTLNAERYRDTILDPVAIPFIHNMGPNALLQDDNARPHRARIIADHLQHAGVERMEWPSKSPDLNPIEHLWDQLGRAVRARVTERTTLADLGRLLVEEWNAIPQHRIARLVTSMRRRCRAVVTARGWATHINECQPCQHGRCENKDGGYRCTCLPGWTGQSCGRALDTYTKRGDTFYKAFLEYKTYNAAEQTCASDGGRLAVIKTEAAYDFLLRLIREADGGRDYWFGLDGPGETCDKVFRNATFTTLGATGRAGPTSLGDHYRGQDHEKLVTLQNGTQLFTVPETGNYRIKAAGAASGKVFKISGYAMGRGALVAGTFSLKKGEVLKILVGQEGVENPGVHPTGGGGGTFVVRSGDLPLIIAGGGGGGFMLKLNHAECDGTTATSGQAGFSPKRKGGSQTTFAGGTHGHGATEGKPKSKRRGSGQKRVAGIHIRKSERVGGGGGGLLTNGGGEISVKPRYEAGEGGRAFVNGGLGGAARGFRPRSEGGFGGGGGGYDGGGEGVATRAGGGGILLKTPVGVGEAPLTQAATPAARTGRTARRGTWSSQRCEACVFFFLFL